MAATASPFLTRKDLLVNPRRLGVIQWPYSAPMITTVKNPTTGALVLPDNGFVVGSHRKERGGALSNAQSFNDIMIHGSGSPAMKIPTERRVGIGVEPIEVNKQNLQNWLGADLSDVVPDAAGGVHLPVPSLPQNILSRVALIGKHDYNGLPCYIAWIGNRVQVSETGEAGLTDADVVPFPYTFDFQGVDELDDEPFFVEILGPGWAAMQAAAPGGAGFGAAIASLAVTPSAPTLDLSDGETQQLTAVDSNGVDRTNQATWVSADPTKVTVSASGVVTPVSTATDVHVTATYGGFSDFAEVTVIA